MLFRCMCRSVVTASSVRTRKRTCARRSGLSFCIVGRCTEVCLLEAAKVLAVWLEFSFQRDWCDSFFGPVRASGGNHFRNGWAFEHYFSTSVSSANLFAIRLVYTTHSLWESLLVCYCTELLRVRVWCPMARADSLAVARHCFTSWAAAHSANTPSSLQFLCARS